MTCHICCGCGTQFAVAPAPTAECPICRDERQFIPAEGQRWTDLSALARDHRLVWRDEADGVASLAVSPHFAIGQRAFLLVTGSGNILWDCLALVEPAMVSRIAELGGIDAIAISHPHFYSAMVEWSRAFGGVPIHIHEDDAGWIARPDPAIVPWRGDGLDIAGGCRLIRCGGHFPGSAVLFWPGFDDGRGALFTGDTLQVVADRRHVSFMYSFPNLIPLGPQAVGRIAAALSGVRFDAVFGAFAGRTIESGGRAALDRSVTRYLAAIGHASGPPIN